MNEIEAHSRHRQAPRKVMELNDQDVRVSIPISLVLIPLPG